MEMAMCYPFLHFTWIRVTLDADQRSEHTYHLMGNHHMLVVGGIQRFEEDPRPEGVLGCDNNPKFKQGLGVFFLNTHSWATNYDPGSGAAPYRITLQYRKSSAIT